MPGLAHALSPNLAVQVEQAEDFGEHLDRQRHTGLWPTTLTLSLSVFCHVDHSKSTCKAKPRKWLLLSAQPARQLLMDG